MNRPGLPLAIVLSAAALVATATVALEFGFAAPAAASNGLSASIPLFEFERQAQLHCPDDSIVWATASAGTYELSSERWYGRTSSGAYGCFHAAVDAGYRAER